MTRGEILFDNVTFHYGKERGLIENLRPRSGRARRSDLSARRAPASRL